MRGEDRFRLADLLQALEPSRSRAGDTRFRNPFPASNSSLLCSTQAYSTKELAQSRILAGVGWNFVECGRLEHKMSTITVPFDASRAVAR